MESKKSVYARYGITFKERKILSPIGWVWPLLKKGNSKVGENVYTFSLLPGTENVNIEIRGQKKKVKGTCIANCKGCYATSGFYRMNNVILGLAVNTYLVNKFPTFVLSALLAQLELIESNAEIRVHAAGDFNTENPLCYAKIWKKVAKQNTTKRFWTYTKVREFETFFDDVPNFNIVRSVIPKVGINFGTCEYIINAYYTLKSLDIPVYICKCGFDENQHCAGCEVCSKYKYVLFIEHSTKYNAFSDPLFEKLQLIVNNQ